MFCPSCGTQNPGQNRFCQECGTKLPEDAAAAAPANPSATAKSADVIDYHIYGEEMQVVEVELDPGEAVQAEAGAFVYMSNGIEMQTSSGGFMKGIKRMFSGEGFFITSFTNEGAGKGYAAFTAPFPSQIIPIDLASVGGTFLCQKDAFLCAARGIEIETAFTKRMGTGFFGGEGFILQKLVGDGLAFLNAGGAIVQKELEPGETLRVDTGCLVAFSPTVDYTIKFIGGFKNALFGGEGAFHAAVTGPGTVYLQSLPFSRLVDRIASAMPKGTRGFSSDDD